MELAEGEGFEPPRPFGLPVFKTGAFTNSAILPKNFADPRIGSNEHLLIT